MADADLSALVGFHQFPQAVGFFDAYKAELRVIPVTAAGFELDFPEREKARQGLLFDADILNPLERNRACVSADNSAFDANIMLANVIMEPHPRQPAKKETEQENRTDSGNGNQRVVTSPRAEKGGKYGKNELRQSGDEADEQAEDVELYSFIPGFLDIRVLGVGIGQIVSARIAARMASRIAKASAWSKPGNVTVLLWLPAVCTVNVARS